MRDRERLGSVHDPLVVLVDLRGGIDLALARDAVTGKAMNYRMLENGRAKPLSYRVVGKEKLTIAGKSVIATKVANTSGDKRTTAWIAPGVPVPVRVVQSEAGSEVFKLQLKSWR